MPSPTRNASVAVVGAGDFIGAAIARRFAAEGYLVFCGRRSADKLAPLVAAITEAGGRAEGRALDARQEVQVSEFLAEANRAAPLEAVIFNVGGNVNFPILDTTERVFRKVWEMACYAGFLTGREAARHLLAHGRGTILFTGATASLRGGSGYAAFAAAKFGLRALAQSMARELGPKNIHVAHLVIDAGVDTAWVRERIAARGTPDRLEPGHLVDPASIAEAYWQLHIQPRDAWTHELDIRPSVEEMVMPRLEFHFDFGSPNAYFAHRVLPEIAARTGAEIAYIPVLLGGVFKATGNRSPMEAFAGIRNKPEYERLETARFIARHGLTAFRRNPHFPVNTLQIMRGAVAAEIDGTLPAYAEAMFHHMWEDPKKLDEPAIIRAALDASGLDGAQTLARIQDPAVKAGLIANTEASVARGTFGSPTFFIGTEMWFGKDRLRDVEEALR